MKKSPSTISLESIENGSSYHYIPQTVPEVFANCLTTLVALLSRTANKFYQILSPKVARSITLQLACYALCLDPVLFHVATTVRHCQSILVGPNSPDLTPLLLDAAEDTRERLLAGLQLAGASDMAVHRVGIFVLQVIWFCTSFWLYLLVPRFCHALCAYSSKFVLKGLTAVLHMNGRAALNEEQHASLLQLRSDVARTLQLHLLLSRNAPAQVLQDWEGTEVVGVPVQTQTYPLSDVGTPPSDYASVRDSPRWADHYSQGDSSHIEHSQADSASLAASSPARSDMLSARSYTPADQHAKATATLAALGKGPSEHEPAAAKGKTAVTHPKLANGNMSHTKEAQPTVHILHDKPQDRDGQQLKKRSTSWRQSFVGRLGAKKAAPELPVEALVMEDVPTRVSTEKGVGGAQPLAVPSRRATDSHYISATRGPYARSADGDSRLSVDKQLPSHRLPSTHSRTTSQDSMSEAGSSRSLPVRTADTASNLPRSNVVDVMDQLWVAH